MLKASHMMSKTLLTRASYRNTDQITSGLVMGRINPLYQYQLRQKDVGSYKRGQGMFCPTHHILLRNFSTRRLLGLTKTFEEFSLLYYMGIAANLITYDHVNTFLNLYTKTYTYVICVELAFWF